jgi:hypothetical protein
MTLAKRLVLRLSVVAASFLVVGAAFSRPVSAWDAPGSGSSRCADDQLTWQATLTITNAVPTHALTVTGLRSSPEVVFVGIGLGTVIDAGATANFTASGLPLSMSSLTVSYDVVWPETSTATHSISFTQPRCTPPPTTVAPTTVAPTTVAPTTVAPTTVAPTTVAPTTVAIQASGAPTTVAPTTTQPRVQPISPVPRAVSPQRSNDLPATGSSHGPMLIVSLLFAACGTALVRWSRRVPPVNR